MYKLVLLTHILEYYAALEIRYFGEFLCILHVVDLASSPKRSFIRVDELAGFITNLHLEILVIFLLKPEEIIFYV